MNTLQVQLVKCLSDNYSYIIFNPISKNAIIIDPAESKPLENEIERNNLKLNYILITHHHADHVDGNLNLKKNLSTIIMDQCRICLEDDLITNMISPCLCRGHMKYIHRECLNQWIVLSENPDNKEKCPTCNFNYQYKQKPICHRCAPSGPCAAGALRRSSPNWRRRSGQDAFAAHPQ